MIDLTPWKDNDLYIRPLQARNGQWFAALFDRNDKPCKDPITGQRILFNSPRFEHEYQCRAFSRYLKDSDFK